MTLRSCRDARLVSLLFVSLRYLRKFMRKNRANVTIAVLFYHFVVQFLLAYLLQKFYGYRLIPLLDEHSAEATGRIIYTLHDLERSLAFVRNLKRDGLLVR